MNPTTETSVIWVTPEVRTSFLRVFEPRANPQRRNTLWFDGVLLFPKTADFAQLRAIATQVTRNALGTDIPARALFPGEMSPGGLKPFFKNGDEMAAAKPDTYDWYRGHWAFSFSAPAVKPIILKDANRQDIINPADLQSGDFVQMSFEVSAYKHAVHGPQLSIKPLVIKKTRTGEHFGGGVSKDAAESALYGGTEQIHTPTTTPGSGKGGGGGGLM